MSKNNFAVLDIGSHSIRMLRIQDGIEETEQIITRLGEGAGAGFLTPEGMDRTLIALRTLAEKAKGLPLYAFATSAVRDARNREDFTARVKQKIGVAVRVLTGEQEARLAYAGASAGVAENALGVIDIGGGSTEIITGKDGAVVSAYSFDVGAVRLTDMGLSAADMTALARGMIHIESDAERPAHWRGVGGTITALAAMDQRLAAYDPARVHGYALTAENVRAWIRRLDGMPVEERMRLAGIQPERGKVILAGVCVLCGTMEALQIETVHACESDNLRGAALILFP